MLVRFGFVDLRLRLVWFVFDLHLALAWLALGCRLAVVRIVGNVSVVSDLSFPLPFGDFHQYVVSRCDVPRNRVRERISRTKVELQ